MSEFDALLDLEDQPDEPWHIDPKDKDATSEIARQTRFLGRVRTLCPAVDAVAIPNAGKRGAAAARRAKREGMRKGALDLVLTWPGAGAAFLEFKNGKSMPTADQRERLNLLFRQGHHCGVFRTPESAIAFLRRAGAPFIDQVRA